MITTKLMLDSLHTWVLVHKNSLQDYAHQYPYSSYLAIDATSTLRNKIADIISHIIRLIAPQPAPLLALHRHASSSLLSDYQINNLCKIKTILDEIKVMFLTVGTVKRVQTDFVLAALEETVHLASLPALRNDKIRADSYHRNRSFDHISQSIRPESTSMRQYDQDLPHRKFWKESKNECKDQLYRQMRQDLEQKQFQAINNRQTRVTSDYKADSIRQKCKINYPQINYLPTKYEKKVVKQKPRQNHQRRLFKYLEDDLEYKRQKREEEQANQFLFQTPEKFRYETLPSTQQKSQSLKKGQQYFKHDLPEYELDQEKLDELKKELDQKLRLSKIQYSEEENPDQQIWQRFQKESTQNDNTVENNLEDSLQLMKQQQALNKTGQFNILPLTNTLEVQEYSFSHD